MPLLASAACRVPCTNTHAHNTIPMEKIALHLVSLSPVLTPSLSAFCFLQPFHQLDMPLQNTAQHLHSNLAHSTPGWKLSTSAYIYRYIHITIHLTVWWVGKSRVKLPQGVWWMGSQSGLRTYVRTYLTRSKWKPNLAITQWYSTYIRRAFNRPSHISLWTM